MIWFYNGSTGQCLTVAPLWYPTLPTSSLLSELRPAFVLTCELNRRPCNNQTAASCRMLHGISEITVCHNKWGHLVIIMAHRWCSVSMWVCGVIPRHEKRAMTTMDRGIILSGCPYIHPNSCQHDTSGTPWGNFFKLGRNFYLDPSQDWFDFSSQRSKVKVAATSHQPHACESIISGILKKEFLPIWH